MRSRIIRRILEETGYLTDFYYEQQGKRQLERIHMSGYLFNERLTGKTGRSKRLGYTGLCGDLEHLTIETRFNR